MFRYDRLDELVKESGKKKNYLCAKLGKCPTYLRDSKKQNTNIKSPDLDILAEELNTTPEYLLGKTDIKEKPATIPGDELGEVTREIMNILYDLTPEELALAKARLLKIKESR